MSSELHERHGHGHTLQMKRAYNDRATGWPGVVTAGVSGVGLGHVTAGMAGVRMRSEATPSQQPAVSVRDTATRSRATADPRYATRSNT